MAYLDDLATKLFALVPGEHRRFWFNPDVRPRLAVETTDPDGLARFGTVMRSARDQAGYGDGWRGALTMDRRRRLVLIGEGAGAPLLQALQAFVTPRIAKMPALAVFCDVGVVDRPVDVRDRAALEAAASGTDEPLRDDALWAAVRTQTLDQLEAIVADFRPGDAGWFHIAQAPEGAAALLLARCGDDPLQIHFRRMVAALGERGLSGIGTALMDDDGHFQFLSQELEPPLLAILGQFVRDHIDAHPGLARLRDASLALVGADLAIRQEIGDDAVWEGIPEVPAPDSVAAAAGIIAGLTPGAQAWFWCPDTPGSTPFFTLYPLADDPSGDAFAAARSRLALRFRTGSSVSPGVIGILEVVSEQTTTLTVPAHLAHAAARAIAGTIHADAWEYPALRSLSEVVVTGMVGQEIRAVVFVEQYVRLQENVDKLAELGPDESLYFWYLSAGVDGRPVVCVDDDRDRLIGASKRWRSNAPAQAVAARGRIGRSADGQIVFFTKQPVDSLLPDVERWARANQPLISPAFLLNATHRVIG